MGKEIKIDSGEFKEAVSKASQAVHRVNFKFDTTLDGTDVAVVEALMKQLDAIEKHVQSVKSSVIEDFNNFKQAGELMKDTDEKLGRMIGE